MSSLSGFTDQQIIAGTAFGENRGGGMQGMQSVINVIQNRANKPSWWGSSMREVCLKPKQFDCWMAGPDYDATLSAMNGTPFGSYLMALDLAAQAIDGLLPDITKGATFYFAKSMSPWPVWASGHTPCADIMGQLFFSDIR